MCSGRGILNGGLLDGVVDEPDACCDKTSDTSTTCMG